MKRRDFFKKLTAVGVAAVIAPRILGDIKYDDDIDPLDLEDDLEEDIRNPTLTYIRNADLEMSFDVGELSYYDMEGNLIGKAKGPNRVNIIKHRLLFEYENYENEEIVDGGKEWSIECNRFVAENPKLLNHSFQLGLLATVKSELQENSPAIEGTVIFTEMSYNTTNFQDIEISSFGSGTLQLIFEK